MIAAQPPQSEDGSGEPGTVHRHSSVDISSPEGSYAAPRFPPGPPGTLTFFTWCGSGTGFWLFGGQFLVYWSVVRPCGAWREGGGRRGDPGRG